MVAPWSPTCIERRHIKRSVWDRRMCRKASRRLWKSARLISFVHRSRRRPTANETDQQGSDRARDVAAGRDLRSFRGPMLGPRADYPSVGNFEQRCRSHATADTHRDHPVASAAATSLQQQMPRHTHAGHAVRMTDRNCSAIDVKPFIWKSKLSGTVKHLASEGLVELPKVDVF